MLTLQEKIQILENELDKKDNTLIDEFKDEIVMYFDDFSEKNQEFDFLNKYTSKEEILILLNRLLSRFIEKFDADVESERDFIYYFIQDIKSEDVSFMTNEYNLHFLNELK